MTPGADRSLGAENNWGIRGTLEADLTDNALLTVLGTYSKSDNESIPGNSYGALRPDGSLNPADWPNAFCGLAEVLRAECLNTLSGLGPISERSAGRSEEHTSELQSLMRTSYAVFCLKKKQRTN